MAKQDKMQPAADVWSDPADGQKTPEPSSTATAPEATAAAPNPSSEGGDAPAKRGRGRPKGVGSGNATARTPAAPKELGEMSLSELGKALTKALEKAKAGQEALNEANGINAEIAKRLG
jgi:hypothetical protein